MQKKQQSSRRSRTVANKGAVLSRRQVIDKIMSMVECLPEAVAQLPPHLRSRKYWQRTLSGKSAQIDNVLAVLREVPAFTDQGPKHDTPAAWQKVFAALSGTEQVGRMLTDVSASASFTPIHRPPITCWREAFGPNEVVQRVRPKESSAYLHNPHRGTTTFQRFQGDALTPSIMWNDRFGPREFPRAGKVADNRKFIPRTTLAYCRWPWAWLEPGKGKFNWKLIDATLQAARERGQTAQLRFQPYTVPVDTKANPPKAKRFAPDTAVDVPDWYWDTGAAWIEQGPFAQHEIDSNDPRYLKHFGDFIRAFGRRYDGHPDLESIDIAYAGFWGEAGGNATVATAERLAAIYSDSFRKTQLVGMLGTPGFNHAFRLGVKHGRPVGWRADSFGDFHIGNSPDAPSDRSWNHMLDAYARSVYAGGAQDAWKTAPVTMETSATVAHWVMDGYDIDRIIEEGYKYHMSVFMPKSVFFPEQVMDKMIAFDRRIGYRFVVRQLILPLAAKPGKGISGDMFLDNIGCAPIYRPYKLALRFQQGKSARVVRFREDIRTWLPGHNFFREELALPPDLGRGEVKVALGIVDEEDKPRVWFAIDGKTDDGWHPLTSMDVVT